MFVVYVYKLEPIRCIITASLEQFMLAIMLASLIAERHVCGYVKVRDVTVS